MSLTDPWSVNIGAGAVSLPRTSSAGKTSEYTSADGLLQVVASHQDVKSGRKRRNLRINASKMTADPFIPSQNTLASMSFYMVWDIPPAGYSNAEVKAVFDGFRTAWAASSDAAITKVIGGEH